MSPPTSASGGSIPLATMWVTCGALGLTGMAVTVRYLEGRVPSWDLSFYRALTVLLIGLVPMLVRNGWRLSAVVPQQKLFWDFLLRGILIFAAQAAYYYALMNMKFADATVLNATVPIFSALLAIVMLSERVPPDRWLLIFIGFAGVVLIIQPGFQTVSAEAGFAVLSAVLFALSGILNKRLVKIASGTEIVYGTNFFVALCGIGVVLVWGVKPTWADLGIVALIGACGAVAQYCFSQALLHADVSYVSPFEFVRVPFAALAGWVLFDEPPPLIFGAGAALIFLSVLLLARRAARARPAAAPDAA
jgi:drug/metabolite transporter (DMT)-like permease